MKFRLDIRLIDATIYIDFAQIQMISFSTSLWLTSLVQQNVLTTIGHIPMSSNADIHVLRGINFAIFTLFNQQY